MAWTGIFGVEFLRDILVALIGIVLGIWLPALLAFRRFRTRQWWEKKAGFYQEVIAVLGNLKRIEDRDLQDEMDGRMRDDDHRARVEWDFEEAQQVLRRLSNEGMFLISEDSQEVIRRYFSDIALAKGKPDAVDRMVYRTEVSNDALMELIAAARTDLGVKA